MSSLPPADAAATSQDSSGSSSQFYADNESQVGEMDYSAIDLSIGYQITPERLARQREADSPLRFFCTKCNDFVQPLQKKGRAEFVCGSCSGRRVAYGTEAAIRHHYLREKDE